MEYPPRKDISTMWSPLLTEILCIVVVRAKGGECIWVFGPRLHNTKFQILHGALQTWVFTMLKFTLAFN